jgi:hypothetical protein
MNRELIARIELELLGLEALLLVENDRGGNMSLRSCVAQTIEILQDCKAAIVKLSLEKAISAGADKV